jgi:signal transduction histidine kinase
MNLIEGHISLLRKGIDDDDDGWEDSLEMIEGAAIDLMDLAESVRRIDRVISTTESVDEPMSLQKRIRQLVNLFADRYPDAEFSVDLPDDPCEVSVGGLTTAIEEAVENAVEHNPSPTPSVDICVERREGEWVDIEVADDGPGIPAREVDVLEGGETPLNHADRLGLWQIHWIVTKAGGEFSTAEAADGGTVVTLSVPLDD